MALTTKQAFHEFLHATRELLCALCRGLCHYTQIYRRAYEYKNYGCRGCKKPTYRHNGKGKH